MSAFDNKLTECGHFVLNTFLNFLKVIAELCEKLCALSFAVKRNNRRVTQSKAQSNAEIYKEMPALQNNCKLEINCFKCSQVFPPGALII